ncbi:MAG: hypothetical protein Q9224_003361 [Gallowayella concinna]
MNSFEPTIYTYPSIDARLADTTSSAASSTSIDSTEPLNTQGLSITAHGESLISSDMSTITVITEEEEYPIALFPTVPRLKFHDAPLYFMSESGLTQQEYQNKLLNKGIPDHNDDTITVKCPDREDGTGRVFRFQRSTLKRSPTFADFFDSPDYLSGCNMVLTFLLDPAVCLEIANKYLEEGPDVFQQTILRVQLTMRYKTVDRSLILVRLYSLAQRLALPLLTDMAYGVLTEGDHLLTASDCITLSSLVFKKEGICDRKLKEWCICRVRDHLPQLQQSEFWDEFLWGLDVEFGQRWIQLLEEPPIIVETVDEAAEAPDANHALRPSLSQQPSPRSTSSAKTKEQAFQEILDDIKQREAAVDKEWDATEDLAMSSGFAGTHAKVVRFFGSVESPPPAGLKREESWPKGMSPSPSSMFSPEVDKAKFVMGFPGTEDQHYGNPSMNRTDATASPTKSVRRLRFWASSSE